MTLPSEDASVREQKLKLRTAYVTLAGVVFGILLTVINLYSQNQNLQRIAQSFEHLNELKKALMMPLEGEWDYETKYDRYIGKQSPKYNLIGKAIFLGKDPGYQVYAGGGVYEGRNNEPAVTLFGTFFLETDTKGIPLENCSVEFNYIARTATNVVNDVSVNKISTDKMQN